MIACFLYKPMSLFTPRIFLLSPQDYRYHDDNGYLRWAWGGVASTSGGMKLFRYGVSQFS